MESRAAAALCSLAVFILAIPLASTSAPPTTASAVPDPLALPNLGGYFVENRGQVSSEVRFYALGSLDVAFRDDGVMFVPPDGDGIAAYLVRFDGANAVAPVGRDALPFRTNFFRGNDPGGWRTDVPAYGEVAYPNLYGGIDLVYRPSAGGVKYEFSVHPGADPSAIRMQYEGVSSLAVEGGGLSMRMIRGVVRDSAPYSYERGGKEVSCPLVMRGPLTVGFACANWDRRQELTIDPVTLLYSTFVGGRGNDVGYGLAVDVAGAASVVGSTGFPDFPSTPGSYQSSFIGPTDGFVVKLTPDGSTLAYATFLGGAGDDYAYKVAVDAAGNAVVTGGTYSADFPVTPGAFQPALRGGQDSYVTKLKPAGNALVYSTFLGGSSADQGGAVAIDPSGAAIVAGSTYSTDFPTTPNAMQRGWHGGGFDAFVAKFGPTGTVAYVTYLGGGGEDGARGAAADSGGYAYITGWTNSVNFTVTDGSLSNASNGGNDA